MQNTIASHRVATEYQSSEQGRSLDQMAASLHQVALVCKRSRLGGPTPHRPLQRPTTTQVTVTVGRHAL